MSVDYLVDEFIGEVVPHTFEEQVDKKISLLYDMRILRRGKKRCPDHREASVKMMLLECKTEINMDNAIRGVILGHYSIDELLKRKGF